MSNDKCRKHFKEKTAVHDFETICVNPRKHGHLIRDGHSMTYENRVIVLLAREQPTSGENEKTNFYNNFIYDNFIYDNFIHDFLNQ